MRHPVVLAVLGLVIVIVATGWVCDYAADSTGPAETIVRAPSVVVFVAWLLFVGAVVAVGLRWRALPAARGLVSGVCILGLFGFLATIFEMVGAMGVTVFYGVMIPAVIEVWLWPARGRWWALVSTAMLLPFTVVAVWFVPGLYGAEALAAMLALAAAAAMAAACSHITPFVSPPRMQPR